MGKDMSKEDFDILMKRLYPDPELRNAVIKGAKISTSLEKHHVTKTKESKKEVDDAISSAKSLLAKIDSKSDQIKFIKGRWCNKTYPVIAIKVKGEWIYYKRINSDRKQKAE